MLVIGTRSDCHAPGGTPLMDAVVADAMRQFDVPPPAMTVSTLLAFFADEGLEPANVGVFATAEGVLAPEWRSRLPLARLAEQAGLDLVSTVQLLTAIAVAARHKSLELNTHGP